VKVPGFSGYTRKVELGSFSTISVFNVKDKQKVRKLKYSEKGRVCRILSGEVHTGQ
jgi:hypothetical protein